MRDSSKSSSRGKSSASGASKAKTGSSRIQVKNPIINRWVKIDTRTGRIVDTKKSPGPYKGVPRG